MANVFEDQAKERFRKSLTFLRKASSLLDDDLIYRAALADAVSAIKNMLQGYLLLRVAATPAGVVTQRWQEIAASNRMPDLIQACTEAGLDLRGLAVDIRRLNNKRNQRTHDDAEELIDAAEAQHAMETARAVQQRIRHAVQGGADARSLPARAAQVARAAVSGQLARLAPQPTRPASADAVEDEEAAAPAASAEPESAPTPEPEPVRHDMPESVPVSDMPPQEAPSEPLDEGTRAAMDALTESAALEEHDAGGDTVETIALPRRRRRPGIAGVLLRALLAATLLLIGVVAGAGVMLPIARGDAPGWLDAATRLLPGTPTPTTTVLPTVTPPATSGPAVAGTLVVNATCQSGATAIALANNGARPLTWSIGSPDGIGVGFATPIGTPARATLSGTLAPNASVTVFASGSTGSAVYHIVVIAPDGAVQLAASAC